MTEVGQLSVSFVSPSIIGLETAHNLNKTKEKTIHLRKYIVHFSQKEALRRNAKVIYWAILLVVQCWIVAAVPMSVQTNGFTVISNRYLSQNKSTYHIFRAQDGFDSVTAQYLSLWQM